MSQHPDVAYATGAYHRAATSVPPATAIVLLYDKAIVLLHRAIEAARAGRSEESFVHVQRTTAILRGLSYILDFERGGDVAESLRRTYTKNILAVFGSFGRPDMPERYLKIADGLAELRDAWAGIAKLPTRQDEALSGARAEAAKT